MKIITFGSRIVDDVIINSSHHNRLRIRGISPFSFNCDRFEKEVISEDDISMENNYLKNMLLMDINKTASNYIQEKEYDYLIVDFAEAFIPFLEIELENGKKIRTTRSDWVEKHLEIILNGVSKKTHSKIKNIQLIEPLKWSETIIREEVSKFCDWLTENFKLEKVIFFEATLPFHKVSSSGIEAISDFTDFHEYKKLAENIFSEVKEKVPCKTIPKMDVSLGAEKCTLRALVFTESYYQYILKSIEDIDTQENSQHIRCEYIANLQKEIDMILLEVSKKTIVNQSAGRKVILIGANKGIKETLEAKCALDVEIDVEYNEDTDVKKIEEKISAIRGCYKDFYIVILHLFNDELLKILYKNGFSKNRDIFIPAHESISLKRFVGEYNDVFHNKIICEKETDFIITGIGACAYVRKSDRPLFALSINMVNQSKIVLGENVLAHKLLISSLSGSSVEIGAETTFAEYCRIVLGDFMQVRVGKDCMFSSKIVLHAADGRSIFSQESEEKTNNSEKIIDTPKGEIVFGEHVWVGYQVFVLPGANIGSGSIIGARSVVNKAFPNNCIIAGNIARVIKKDIGWARDPFETDIYGAGLDEDYLKLTETF